MEIDFHGFIVDQYRHAYRFKSHIRVYKLSRCGITIYNISRSSDKCRSPLPLRFPRQSEINTLRLAKLWLTRRFGGIAINPCNLDLWRELKQRLANGRVY